MHSSPVFPEPSSPLSAAPRYFLCTVPCYESALQQQPAHRGLLFSVEQDTGPLLRRKRCRRQTGEHYDGALSSFSLPQSSATGSFNRTSRGFRGACLRLSCSLLILRSRSAAPSPTLTVHRAVLLAIIVGSIASKRWRNVAETSLLSDSSGLCSRQSSAALFSGRIFPPALKSYLSFSIEGLLFFWIVCISLDTRAQAYALVKAACWSLTVGRAPCHRGTVHGFQPSRRLSSRLYAQ
jgi:hypothetical protein